MSTLEGKSILVTGGTGSLGRAFIKEAISLGAREITVFSRDEAKQYEMETSGEFAGVNYYLGDIRQYEDIEAAIRGADIVVHAAALKQVPICEYSPEQAVRTNCLGTQNLIRAVAQHGQVETVVGVSTDKACEPTTVMGMTKAIQERMLIAANIEAPLTRFIGVRYGNVMGSRGSVIPLFLDQIRRGGPVTITDNRMTRFLITLYEAVTLIVDAIGEANDGEIYVRDALSAKVTDIAAALICANNKSTYMAPTGRRPGEKLHEVLVSEEECWERRDGYIVVLPALLKTGWPEAVCGGLAITSESPVVEPEELERVLTDAGFIS